MIEYFNFFKFDYHFKFFFFPRESKQVWFKNKSKYAYKKNLIDFMIKSIFQLHSRNLKLNITIVSTIRLSVQKLNNNSVATTTKNNVLYITHYFFSDIFLPNRLSKCNITCRDITEYVENANNDGIYIISEFIILNR
jgi:ribonuclease P protein component